MTAPSPRRPRYTVKILWGIAKSPELRLEEDEVYALIYRETGKEHIRDLYQGELDRVCRALAALKDSTIATQGGTPAQPRKRTDVGGNPQTEALRRKIYHLTGELGWNGDTRRINGFIKKMTGVERLEWLTATQCHTIIEALKKMAAREEAQP